MYPGASFTDSGGNVHTTDYALMSNNGEGDLSGDPIIYTSFSDFR